MNYDALTLMAVADELRHTIVGGRIQRVIMPAPHSLALEIYHAGRRFQVFASADPRTARVHLLSAKPSRGVEQPTPLMLLLRKYVRNGFVEAVEQPELERVLIMRIVKRPPPRSAAPDEDDVDAERRCELIFEVMGQRSNIILVDDDNLILDAVKRVPSGSTRRVMLPREPYFAPPKPPHRRDPRTITANGVRALLAEDERDLGKALSGAYAGVSPQQAREAIFRATGQPAAQLAPDLPFVAIADALRSLWTEPFAPSLAYEGDQPIAFAPYLMQQYAVARAVDSMGAALEAYYAAAEQITAHAQRRAALLARLADVRERIQRQYDALARELERAAALDRLRWEGEMIFGYLHEIQPGQRAVIVDNQTIKLDPDISPVENAQARFREYDKAKGALAGVPERLAATEGQLRYVDETIALLELAEGYEAIAAMEREVEEQGLLKPTGGKTGRGPRSAPLRLTSSDGLPIVVGRSAGQNDEVTFRIARPDDLWLHVKDWPGAHVVVHVAGDVPDQTLLEAAGLAVYFSRARTATAAEVILTQRRHVRKVPGGPPGLVTVHNERSIRAAPVAPGDLQTAPPDRR